MSTRARSMSSRRTLTSQLASGLIGGSASGRERLAAAAHLGPVAQTVRVARAERAPGLDRLDDRGTAAEERVPVARLRLLRDAVAELLIRLAVGRVDVVLIEAIRTLHDVRIQVDHDLAVPAHGDAPPPSAGRGSIAVGRLSRPGAARPGPRTTSAAAIACKPAHVTSAGPYAPPQSRTTPTRDGPKANVS